MKTVITAIPLKLDKPAQDIFYGLSISKKHDFICFLDSSLVPNKYSNFSYLAWEPDFAVRSWGSKNEFLNLKPGYLTEVLNGRNETLKADYDNPLAFLRKILNENQAEKTEKYFIEQTGSCNNGQYKISRQKNKKNPAYPDFTGGFIGYFSYDLKNFIESLPSNAVKDVELPVFYLVFYSRLIAFNHKTNTWLFIKSYITEDGFNGGLPEKIVKDIIKEKKQAYLYLDSIQKNIEHDLKRHIAQKYNKNKTGDLKLLSNFSKPDYLSAVIKAKKHIHNGDIYQVNMTQRFACQLDVETADLYYILRLKNPAPFSAFFGFPGFSIGSSSPERFLYLKGRKIQTRPIKGTRPRGLNHFEDIANAKELSESAKDRAELNMIVDLERNDLGRFCQYGTVSVNEHAVIEKYARVLHLVSTVSGQVRKGHDIVDILKATFPGGSITGAPKIRAMEIIDTLEPVSRNIYTGSLGYIGIDGTMDLNIVIRTFIIKGKDFYYNVGGGIVEDSDPESEYTETLDKGVALKETLEFFTGSRY